MEDGRWKMEDGRKEEEKSPFRIISF